LLSKRERNCRISVIELPSGASTTANALACLKVWWVASASAVTAFWQPSHF